MGRSCGCLHQLANENSESSLNGGHADSIAEEPQLIGAIVCGDVQDGIVQPMGKPIRVSTQRGFSLPLCCLSTIGVSSLYSRSLLPRPLLWSRAVGVPQQACSFRFFTPCPLARITAICSGVFGPCASWACGVAHNPWRLPLVLLLAGAAWPCTTLTACPSVCSDMLGRDGGCVPVMESFQSRALAVGQFASAITLSDRFSPYRSPFGPIRSLPSLGRPAWQSFVRAVGQDENSLPLVRRAAFTR